MYDRIRALREDADLKQKNLAEVLNIRQPTYSDYVRGNLNVPAPALIALARFYHTSVDYILGLADIPGTRRRESGSGWKSRHKTLTFGLTRPRIRA